MTGYSSNTMIKIDRESDYPIDTVQSILWDPYDKNARSFFTCGWDGYVRYYAIEGVSTKKLQKKWQYFFQHPVISMDVTSSNHVIAGLATGHVGIVDMRNTNNSGLLGMHEAPICKIVWIQNFEVLLTLGFDNVIKIFSLKQNNNNFQIGEIALPAKTNTAAYSFPYLLVGAQDGRIALLNVQKLQTMNIKNQYQYLFDQSHGIIKFTASALSKTGGKLALGTTDGKIVSATFSQSSSYSNSGIRIAKPFVTRIQKKTNYRKDTHGQINALDFGIKDKSQFLLFCGTFESGVFNLDRNMKAKIFTSDTAPPSTAISVSPDCEYYALASGVDWCRGIDDLNKQQARVYAGRLNLSDVNMGSSSYIR